MTVHAYAEARLGRWSVWYHHGRKPGPAKVISWYGPLILDRNVEQLGIVSSNCPVDVTEAEETQRCVAALGVDYPELRDAVFQAYLYGGTVEQKMKSLGCKSRQTYYNRLERAYVKLLGLFNDAAADVPLPAPRAPTITMSVEPMSPINRLLREALLVPALKAR